MLGILSSICNPTTGAVGTWTGLLRFISCYSTFVKGICDLHAFEEFEFLSKRFSLELKPDHNFLLDPGMGYSMQEDLIEISIGELLGDIGTV